MIYFFDIEKCKCCPYKEGCYKEGSKKKKILSLTFAVGIVVVAVFIPVILIMAGVL